MMNPYTIHAMSLHKEWTCRPLDLLSSFLTLCNSGCVSSPAKDRRKIDSAGK